MSNLREIFDAIDTDHNGFVDKKELTTVVRACNEAGMLGDKPLSESEVEKMAGEIMDICDKGTPDGKLTFEEFQEGMKKITK
ncbi:hypothetical protein LSH36_834g02077 [Paralvinella palmiformis]|uniref:EF-hand domain-containing protein n=1 Tax=Paralvinella palmiformis TaxID=53620 RepID=A0AAD9MRX3_9ANNE|nr:hypothetical protein LSH36_834g02077 [Paralvinella palmiformis]